MNSQMKKWLFSVAVVSAAFLQGFAQVEKSRDVNKTFTVTSNNHVNFSTKYGEVHINTWDKNTIEVKATITAKKRNDSRALEALDQVSVTLEQSGNEVEIETNISGSLNNRNGEKLTIDYVVNMPKSNSLNLRHAYGELYLDDLDGDVSLRMSYGNMKVGKLSGETTVKLAYGNGEIDMIAGGELNVSYSNLNVEESGDVEVSNQYSNIDVEKSQDMDISNKYGNFIVDDVNSVKGNSKYGKVSITKLYNTLVLEISHGSGVNVRWISKNFNWIDIDSSYASSTLRFERGFSAELEGLFKYCDLKYDKEEFDFNYVDKSSNSSEYKGKIGATTASNSKIKLRSDYGNIRIGYSTL